MSFNLADTFASMQPFALAIVAVLGLMAMGSISVFVERIWVYYKSRKSSREFGAQAAKLLEARDYDALVKLAATYRASHLAGLLSAGMKTYGDALRKPGELSAMELTRRELARKSDAVSTDVRRG